MSFRSLAPLLFFAAFLGTDRLRAQNNISRTQAAFAGLSGSEAGGPQQPSCSPCQAFIRKRFYASAHGHPLPPQDATARETIRALGVNGHRFVRVDLRDGSSLTGGILSLGERDFVLSKGAFGAIAIEYSSLKRAPQSTAAPAEHFENGLKWTGLVVATPLVLALLPFMAAGLIQD